MIGVLFHSPEVFDSFCAQEVIEAIGKIDDIKCTLAGTMCRTAVIDSGITDIEICKKTPSRCLADLSRTVDSVIIVTYGKSENSGMVLGKMIGERSGIDIPLIQLECSTRVFMEWILGANSELIEILKGFGFRRVSSPQFKKSVWRKNGKGFRRLQAACIDDFILVEGIIVGKVVKEDVIFICERGCITNIKGANVNSHGLDHLKKFGKIDISRVKIGSTPSIRRIEHIPKITPTRGNGVAFVDHAAMYVYDLTKDIEGVVTVGDDTTDIVGDIMYRFQIPIIGIVDGDKNGLLKDIQFTNGSVKITTDSDDKFGEKVFIEVFDGRQKIEKSFKDTYADILAMGKDRIINLTSLSC